MSNEIDDGIYSLYEEYYYNIFSTTNFCRLIFYTPILFSISVISSVAYDYFTYKDYDEKKNK